MTDTQLDRIAAFTNVPEGGNPAGVWIGDELPSEATMLAIAADVGYSETVFATPATDNNGSTENRFVVRYFSPKAEVPFCGHATIALGARLARDYGAGRYVLATAVGEVPVEAATSEGIATATLTSVEPSGTLAEAELVDSVLSLLGWQRDELDPLMWPAVTFGGAHHLLLAAATRERLANVDYDFDALAELMIEHDLTTVNLIWREAVDVFHSRNLFPVGGVVEDPATGAAAAALGGYLRRIEAIAVPGRFTIHQGADMGRPSRIEVAVPCLGGIEVTGAAVSM